MRATALLVLCIGLSLSGAQAQTYPSRAVTLIVHQAPGSPVDILARVLSKHFAKAGADFVVANRTGALGSIAAKACGQAAPDGYTLCMTGDGPIAVLPAVMEVAKQPPYPPLTPIGIVANQYYVLVVRKGLAADFPSFVAYARANPDALNCGSGHFWGSLSIGMLNNIEGVRVQEVPYKGGEPQILVDLLSGRIDCSFFSLTTMRQHIEAGTVQALGIFGADTNPFLHTVPHLASFGYKEFANTESWWGFMGPAKLPPSVISFVSNHLQAALKDPEVLQAFTTNSALAKTDTTPQVAERMIAQQITRAKELLCKQKIKILDHGCVE